MNEASVIRDLVEQADLAELVQSIAASGYMNFEPLIICKEHGEFLVLEGNRRLAALRVLRSPDLAQKAGLRLPLMEDDAASTLDEVLVLEVKERQDARAFIGFKHINGPHRWDSYAKARFAARWYREALEKGEDISLSAISDRMGDLNATVPRMVSAIYVLDQAIDEKLFSPDDKKQRGPFAFSHFYTSLTYPATREFLGIENWDTEKPPTKPVPNSHLRNLKELLEWLYGSKREDRQPVIRSQNPDVKHLSDVLAKPIALAILRQRRDLGAAYERIDSGRENFNNHLVSAATSIDKATASVNGYDGSSATWEVAESMKDRFEQLLTLMSKIKTRTKGADGPR